MGGRGRGIEARTSRCCPPSPDGLLGPPSREAIRGAPYKGQELRGRRSRQSNSFQTRAVRVYSSIQFSESIVAGFGRPVDEGRKSIPWTLFARVRMLYGDGSRMPRACWLSTQSVMEEIRLSC